MGPRLSEPMKDDVNAAGRRLGRAGLLPRVAVEVVGPTTPRRDVAEDRGDCPAERSRAQ